MVVVLVVAMLPARTVARAAADIDGLVLLGVRGAWWNGQAHVVYHGFEAGRFAWTLRPSRLLVGELRVDWRLSHASRNLSGSAALGLAGRELAVAGVLDAASVNQVLGPYDMNVNGTFDVSDLWLRTGREPGAGGAVRWTGGRTVYRLSGRTYDVEMPVMFGRLAAVAGATERADGRNSETPKDFVLSVFDEHDTALVTARLAADGWLHIGVTRRFTVLADNPWPGTSADDAVVVTVSEQVL